MLLQNAIHVVSLDKEASLSGSNLQKTEGSEFLINVRKLPNKRDLGHEAGNYLFRPVEESKKECIDPSNDVLNADLLVHQYLSRIEEEDRLDSMMEKKKLFQIRRNQ